MNVSDISLALLYNYDNARPRVRASAPRSGIACPTSAEQSAPFRPRGPRRVPTVLGPYSSTRYSFVIRVSSVHAEWIRIGARQDPTKKRERERERREKEEGRTDRKEKIGRRQAAEKALSRISSTALNDLALGNLIDTGQTGGPDFKRLALPPLLPSSSSSFATVLPPAALLRGCFRVSIGRSVGRSVDRSVG